MSVFPFRNARKDRTSWHRRPFPPYESDPSDRPVQLLQKALNVGASTLPKLTPDGQFGPNSHSIFATYCYKASGLNVTWDDAGTQSSAKFDKVMPGACVYSIDGNVGNPREQDVAPWNSVVSERYYLRSTLTSKNGLFLRPKFSAM